LTPEPKIETPVPKAELSSEEKILKDLDNKLTVLKERGNLHYGKKAFKEAVKCFSEGILMFSAVGSPMDSEEIKTKVT
jgi:hypothetical protein